MLGAENAQLVMLPLGRIKQMAENNEHLLAKPILQLYEALSALNGFVSILNNQLDSFRKGTIKLYEENDIDIPSSTGWADSKRTRDVAETA